MSNRPTPLTAELHEYLLRVSLREPEILERLRQETASHPRAGMQIAPEQGQFMRLLLQLMGARKVLEIGVFTGYSSLSAALALPEDGRIVACDVSEEYTSIARRYWAEAGVAGKISLHLAPAAETLANLIARGEVGTFDFAFIDADKASYDVYYERSLQLVRRGGLIVFDNVLWGGDVLDSRSTDADTMALQALNRKLHRDERIVLSMLPLSDGMTLALRR